MSLSRIRHFALDMDGTIYKGATVFEETKPFLELLRRCGLGWTFLTNNSSRSTRAYVRHLRQMGIGCKSDQVYTSTQSTLEYLRRERPRVRKVYVLGTRSLRKEVEGAGLAIAGEVPEDAPDAVIVGFDTGLTFSRLCRAAYWIRLGKPFIATHPDRVCPTDEPTVLVDCGSVCAALAKATGRRPEVVLGKPDPEMLRGILSWHDLHRSELAMVGDRLYTDMAMARRAGVMSILVLTGETTANDLRMTRMKPDLVVKGLGDLGKKLNRSF